MASQELLDRIAHLREGGIPDEKLVKKLTEEGWESADVTGALAVLQMQKKYGSLGTARDWMTRPQSKSGGLVWSMLVLILIVVTSGAYEFAKQGTISLPLLTLHNPASQTATSSDLALQKSAQPLSWLELIRPTVPAGELQIPIQRPSQGSNGGGSSQTESGPVIFPTSTGSTQTTTQISTNTTQPTTPSQTNTPSNPTTPVGTATSSDPTPSTTPPVTTPPVTTPSTTPTTPPTQTPPTTPDNSNSSYQYVCPDATGAGTGADWTNAFTSFPKKLIRGDTYYICGSSTMYPAADFNDPVSGSSVITIKKATESNHGTNTGWQSSYGSQVATFPQITIEQSYYTIDGSTGGGPSSWTSGFGIEIYETNPKCYGYRMFFQMAINPVSYITIEHVYAHQDNNTYPMRGINGTAGGHDLIVRDTYFKNLFGAAYYLIGWDNVDIEDSAVNHLRSTNVDPYCPYMHAELVSSQGVNNNWLLKDNIWNDIGGTAVLAGVNTGTSTNWTVTGNIIDNSVTSVEYYYTGNDFNSMSNLQFYNNDILHEANPSQGAIVINNGTGNRVYNNIWYDNDSNGMTFVGVDHDYNWFYGNVRTTVTPPASHDAAAAASEPHGQLGTGNPFVSDTGDPFTSDFHLVAPTDPGMALSGSYFATDFDATARGVAGNWSRGAYQYAGAQALAKPAASSKAAQSTKIALGTLGSVSVPTTSLVASAGGFFAWLKAFFAWCVYYALHLFR